MACTTLTFSTLLLLLAAVTTTAVDNSTASATNETATQASTVYATDTTAAASVTAASNANSASAATATAAQTTAASGATSTSAATVTAAQTTAASGATSTSAATATAAQTTSASGATSTSAATATAAQTTAASGATSTTIQASSSSSSPTTAAPLNPSCSIVNNGTTPGNFQLAVSPLVLSSNTVYNVTVNGTGNATVVLQAMAGTSFVGSWSNKNSTCTGGSPLYTVLLNANTSLVAQWTSDSNLNPVIISAYIQVNNTYKHTITLNPASTTAPSTTTKTTVKSSGTTNKPTAWSFDLAASLIVLLISTKLLQ